jgi:tRNA (guanine-N7-)-methyltransferase
VRLSSEERPLDWRALFEGTPSALWFEIGFGKGEHLAWQAAHHPDIAFIGCEPFEEGIGGLLAAIDREGLRNVRIYPNDGLVLLRLLAEASVARLFALFPDPWPKRRHHKRRLIRAETVPLLARALADGAELRLATDHPLYARAMLAALSIGPDLRWTARRAADWRTRPPDWPKTRYEAKAEAEGRPGVYLVFRRRPRGGAPRGGAPSGAARDAPQGGQEA